MAGPYFSDDIRRVLDSAALSGVAWARMQVPGNGPYLAWVLAGYWLALSVLAVAFGVGWEPGMPGSWSGTGRG